MKIEVKRFEFSTNYTIGRLYINGDYHCYTLEDTVREVPGVPVDEWKIAGKTAIPRGTYGVVVDMSVHFNREMPHILNVPGYEGVRIHSGNTDADTEGCILVGTQWNGVNFIGGSHIAFEEFFKDLKDSLSKQEKVLLEIS